jgi:hypothetical protein
LGFFKDQEIDRKTKIYSSKENCKHERSEKEYFLGSSTGDRICLDCGATFYPGSTEKKDSGK